MPVGTEKRSAASKGLFFHHSQTNCEFNWNQPKVWPNAKRKQANRILKVGN